MTVPTEGLTSKNYAKQLATTIPIAGATPSEQISPGLAAPDQQESHETTHFSVIDCHGNTVVNTYTLNLSYGSRIIVPGTGILLK
ncbi:MAG: Gamma-glutamyltranspeptidase [Verrucomicrobia subdivision 3 bacterium]|nr:Gamma-glutamyltranspeptidase [Limisphaerales bacterium]